MMLNCPIFIDYLNDSSSASHAGSASALKDFTLKANIIIEKRRKLPVQYCRALLFRLKVERIFVRYADYIYTVICAIICNDSASSMAACSVLPLSINMISNGVLLSCSKRLKMHVRVKGS